MHSIASAPLDEGVFVESVFSLSLTLQHTIKTTIMEGSQVSEQKESRLASTGQPNPVISEQVSPTPTPAPAPAATKSDLRNTKTELFNKLIASNQSQQIIVSAAVKSENVSQVEASTQPKINRPKSFDNDQEQENQRTNPSELVSNLQHQSLLPQDFKKEAVVFARFKNKLKWYTNDEVASILTNFSSHPEWQTNELQVRPKSGAVLLYSRAKVRYRQDGYCWKKRKNGRTTREDHMKLKVQGIECIYGCYVHSAILPTFHRRCYWLLQNPDIVLVHYLNQPPDDQGKMMLTFNPSLLESETRRSWTNEEIIEEIGSVFGGISQIQHTLNINFPPSNELLQSQQIQLPITRQQSNDADGMIESSPQSQTTTNSEVVNEQVDMSAIDFPHQQEQRSFLASNVEAQNHMNPKQYDDDDDDMMTTLTQDNCGIHMIANCTDLNNGLNCDDNGHHHHQQQQQQQSINGHEQQQHEDETTSMTFDIDNEFDNTTRSSLGVQPSVDCFAYHQDPSAASLGVSNSISDQADLANSVLANEQAAARMERNSCSPVTQIYNKIVDDIETYALPLELNQFNSNHHHSLSISSLPVQSMELGESGERQHHQQQHNHHQQHQQQLANHHIGQTNIDRARLDGQHRLVDHSSVGSYHSMSKSQSACSMEFATCDLFGSSSNQVDVSVHNGAQDGVECTNADDDNLLLNEFSLQPDSVAGQENDELETNVVDSLSNADDLRDLIMGISPDEQHDDHHNGLLPMDSNSLDLFNFKSTNDSLQQRQQLDVKSSLSDTDTINRLSPLASVPRCNSTSDAIQTSSNLLMSNQVDVSLNQFSFCENRNEGNLAECRHQISQRSSSTNPTSSSNSCSPSPSSMSLRTGVAISTRSACIEDANHNHQYHQYMSSATSPSSGCAFMKLPLQQRQNSEQQEPSNSVLSSLLPKALSLDGSDLTSKYHLDKSISFSPKPLQSDPNDQSNQTNLLLIPSRTSAAAGMRVMATQYSSNLDPIKSNSIAPLGPSSSPSIPIYDSSEILVSAAAGNFHSSSGRDVLRASIQEPQYLATASRSFQGAEVSGIVSDVLLPILDYVPNWCNISGGAKVLIVGDWSSLVKSNSQDLKPQMSSALEGIKDGHSATFFAIFDDQLVPATMIQDNVLRCYAPSHKQGFITLKVLYMNQIVSEQVLFEMRPSCNQAANQLAPANSSRNNQNDGQNPPGDAGNHNDGTNNTHRNSTSSNQSEINNSVFPIQRPQASPSGKSISDDAPKVLSLAENIISGMHRKNNQTSNKYSEFRLTTSLDIESHDYKQMQQFKHQAFGMRGNQRRLTGSRSLSRDSEPNCPNNFLLNQNTFDGDPYWHDGSLASATNTNSNSNAMQPLSVVTDFVSQSHQPAIMLGQKRHSSGSSDHFHYYNHSNTLYPQRPTLAMLNQVSASNNHYPSHEIHTTETSSSGLGSIVSSLSPSTSSLHSPSSACTATRDGAREDAQLTCSCGRQSSGTPTSADFCEYFQASAKTEESFASLTLNDHEQQELYEAAKVIQKAYRTYRGRKRQAGELLIEQPNHVFNMRQMMLNSKQMIDESQVQSMCGASNILLAQRQPTGASNDASSSHELPDHHLQQQQRVRPLPGQQNFCYQNPLRPIVQHVQQAPLVKCYQDREMQAATIIQAYYRRYRQYVHYKRQQSGQTSGISNGSNNNRSLAAASTNTATAASSQSSAAQQAIYGNPMSERYSPGARLVVDTVPILIGKATSSHVDRKRFKTAILISGSGGNAAVNNANYLAQAQQGRTS